MSKQITHQASQHRWRVSRHLTLGFSLVELLVVVSILSLLASIAFPLTELAQRRTREEELRRSLREIRSALDAYKRYVDQGRIARPADGTGYPATLDALVEGMPDAQSPRQAKLYLLRRLPRDPFASDPSVPAAATWGLRSYASPPDAPQPGQDVFDVYSLAAGQGLNGIPYREW